MNRKLFSHLLLLALIPLACSQTSSPDFNNNSDDTAVERDQPCIDGQAGSYPCRNVDLRARLTPADLQGVRLNDIWGWTDPQSGVEYALVGLTDGVSFVDISSPSDPVVVGVLPEAVHSAPKAVGSGAHAVAEDDETKGDSSWRDLKVHMDHLFVVSDGQAHGLQVFDLDRLRNVTQPPATFSSDALYAEFGNAHNLAINEETGYAYVVGSSVNGGGLYILDVSTPTEPAFVASYADTLTGYNGTGYIHDTQCAIYNGPDSDYTGDELCFNSNETHFTIVNVSDKQSIYTVSRNDYDGRVYAHQGWLTEDQRFFLLDDELDESRMGHNTRTYIWNIEDLDSPELLGFYESANGTIDHNLYVKGNHVYQSNYTAGLRILNIDNIGTAELEEVAYFDTYPLDNQVKFDGTWSNYPFFESGIVVVSDMSNGLFILEPSLP